jgi:sulfur relay (sulfurtransferase) DsrF/TusC family protein
MNVNFKKLTRYFLFMLIGLFLISYGVISLATGKVVKEELTDDEIISRAKDLGMVEIRDIYINESNLNEENGE